MTRVVLEPPSPVYVAAAADGISPQSSTMEVEARAKLQEKIKAQGDVVRKLKEAKADKSQVRVTE